MISDVRTTENTQRSEGSIEWFMSGLPSPIVFLQLQIYLINSSSADALPYRYSGLLESDPTISISWLYSRIKLNTQSKAFPSTPQPAYGILSRPFESWIHTFVCLVRGDNSIHSSFEWIGSNFSVLNDKAVSLQMYPLCTAIANFASKRKLWKVLVTSNVSRLHISDTCIVWMLLGSAQWSFFLFFTTNANQLLDAS